MTPTRPYFLRAVYEWILDNQCTPYLAVNAVFPGVVVPQEHIVDGKIILNISPEAVNNLLLTNEGVQFGARFSGMARHIDVPIGAVLGIYAKENGQGMAFPEEEYPLDDKPEPPPSSPPTGRPTLKVVK